MQFGTKAIHAGVHPDPTTGAIMTPIYQTSTYVQESPGKHKGYEYARTQNPTRDALQANLAALENGQHGLCFASGLAATDAILKLCKPGDEIIASSDLYGGTYRIMVRVFEPLGLTFKFVSLDDPANLDAALTERTRMVWIETPTNPLLRLVDINAIAQRTRRGDDQEKNIRLVVDNTFASPYLQNPLDLGADVVVHSVTKYIGGHSDTVMGAIITNDDDTAAQLRFIQNACGAVPGPQDCFLALRGIKTLHVRMQRHCENAQRVAEYLDQHPRVGKVYYPGLPSHPGHELAARQMRGFGGMLSFELTGDSYPEAIKVMESIRLFSLGESLGGVESLCTHPASMTHASIPKEERLKNGLKDTLIRLSVGIEDADDLIADLEQALAA
ncbi:Cystathionine gamma-lyase [Fibrella aestuarina BUZ 2]|uniref:Cystathionine gamma-lyase n=1 Tax=Fibrella aestuarina BUZ 2 TaxID=1166018 RepID=I0K9Q1_9BACT|nr:cystathionine gamma-synthase [Fibrella aestuarina]CCH00854.1 Cystathionine gamma-lyase [Fibrella aestuarina BUZ 2]